MKFLFYFVNNKKKIYFVSLSLGNVLQVINRKMLDPLGKLNDSKFCSRALFF